MKAQLVAIFLGVLLLVSCGTGQPVTTSPPVDTPTPALPILINTEIRFTELYCCEDGETGDAEPYLWVVFFRIDGHRLTLKIDSDTLMGSFIPDQSGTYVDIWRMGPPNVVSHGNVGGGISDGETRSLDRTNEIAGHYFWESFGDLLPIPVYFGDAQKPTSYTSGYIGAVAILMEEDQTPDEAVIEGYQALRDGLDEGLNRLIADYEFDFITWLEAQTQGEEAEISIPDESIDSLTREVAEKVESAIKDKIKEDASLWDILLAAVDSDDKLGTAVWYWTTDELNTDPTIKPFCSEMWWPTHFNPTGIPTRYISLGKWQLFGEVRAERLTITGSSSLRQQQWLCLP